MTRLEIRNLVIEATRRTDKVSLINSAINLGLEELSSARAWYDLMVQADLSLPLGTNGLALPSDFARGINARLIDVSSPLLTISLRIRPKTWISQHFPYPEGRPPQKPVYGYIDNRTLYTIPLPWKDYTLRLDYCRLHPTFTLDTDVLLIRHAGPAIAAYATFWTFLSIEKAQEAQNWLSVYRNQLQTAMKLDRDNTITKFEAEGRDEMGNVANWDYWVDPFVKSMP